MSNRTSWRLFPWALAAGMAVVIAVNGGMVYAALHSFPGSAGDDGFDLSNDYDRVLDSVNRRDALGWSVRAGVDKDGRPVLDAAGRGGAPIAGAAIVAGSVRPLGDPMARTVTFREIAPGHYEAGEALPARGQWDLNVRISAGGHEFAQTRRVVVR